MNDDLYLKNLITSQALDSPHWLMCLPGGKYSIAEWTKKLNLTSLQSSILEAVSEISNIIPLLVPVGAVHKKRSYFDEILKYVYQCVYLTNGKEALESISDIQVGFSIVDEINAVTLKTPKGNPAILFNNMAFLVFPIVCTMVFEYLSERQISSKATSNKEILNDITVISGFTGESLASYSDSQLKILLELLYLRPTPHEYDMGRIINMFIFLHEYGHVFHDHLDESQNTELNVNGTCKTVTNYKTSVSFEYAADKYALSTLKNFIEKGINDNGTYSSNSEIHKFNFVASICIFFGVLSTNTESFNQREQFQSHPTPYSRWVAIKKELSGYDFKHIEEIESIFFNSSNS